MQYERDAGKAARNLETHGIGFDAIHGFDWHTALSAPDTRTAYGEVRVVALGLIGNRVHVCVYTQRGGVRRIISLRKANRRETRAWIGG